MTPDTTAMLRDQTQRLVRFAEDVSGWPKPRRPLRLWRSPISTCAELIVKTTAAGHRALPHQAGVAVDASIAAAAAAMGRPAAPYPGAGEPLDNALRHTPPHGQVDAFADTDGARLLLRVVDTGEGIAAEHLPHVFERLYRADAARTRDHGGAGLGLAIAKALVEAHGGQISASSQGPGTGTTFTVALPLPTTSPVSLSR